MDKQRIKHKVIAAYKDAKQYPDFLSTFKHNIQDVIDSEVPTEVTHSADVFYDLDHLSQMSKRNNDNAANYLRVIAGYIAMIVKAVEQGNKKIDAAAMPDLFDEDEEFNPNKF